MDRLATGQVFDAAASTYDTVVPFFTTFAEHLVSVIGIEPGEHVLDLACGRGAVLQAARVRGAEVVGVDASAGMVADVPGAQVGDAEALDWPDASFDVVTCGFGVFFFPNPAVALVEAHRVLRGGGRFAATVFAEGRGQFPWSYELVPEHRRTPALWPSPLRTADGLVAGLAEAGFSVDAVVRVEERFRFDDVDHYLAWMRSHAGRMTLAELTDDELATYRSAAAERLAGDDHTLVQAVDVVTATAG